MTESEIEIVITKFFVEREGEGVLDVLREIDLIDEGILDSLDLVALASYIETNLGKTIDVTSDQTLETFRSFESLVASVSSSIDNRAVE